jgi:hypothetical protein
MAGEGDLLSTLREQLIAQLSRFDDEAFAALANRGLLRRAQKDIEKQTASIVEETADTLTLAFGEHRIGFDARGPAHARCSCPASGVCQHILSAAISLQRLGNAEPAAVSAPTATSAEALVDALAQLQAALLRITVAELTKHAGKAGYRWAWQFLDDLDGDHALKISGERYLVLNFSHPRIGFRYLGGGIESLIADVDTTQIEKYRVAAVIAYQRAHGIEVAAPEPTGKPHTAALDLGKDHSGSEMSADALRSSRERLRDSAKQLFSESIDLGLAHLSRGMYERYATLAVWAQGAEYYRLALLLRRIADHVELLLERAGGADEHRLLDELTLALGLVSALDAAAVRGAAPLPLVGRARTRYEAASALELLGLGARPWRSASGYVGLTMIFWSQADKAFLSCADARPEQQRGFNPIARYKQTGPWSGLGAPEQATGQRLILTGAQINAAGRLSASDNTSVAVAPLDTPLRWVESLQPLRSWPEIAQLRSLSRRSLLAEPQPMKDWAVLAPKRFGVAQFDDARQTLVWPLYDDHDHRLDVELAYDDCTRHAITRIEQLRPDELREGTLVVARVYPGPNGLRADPLSLVRAQPASGECAVDALYFDAAPAQGFVSKWLGSFQADREAPAVIESGGSLLPGVLRDYRHWLQRQAERGMADTQLQQVRAEASAWAERAAAAGLSAFARTPTDTPRAGAVVLQAHYLCLQYERLLSDTLDDAA